MSKKTDFTAFVKSSASLSTYNGSMEVANNTSMPITNVSAEHCSSGASTATLTAASMISNSDAGPKTFSTASHTDYWFVSFLDSTGNLCTGSTTLAFHSSDEGTTVEISLQPTQFIVAIGGRTSVGAYLQKQV